MLMSGISFHLELNLSLQRWMIRITIIERHWGVQLRLDTLHPTPSMLHPTTYTLHPTPYTLHPAPYTSRVAVGFRLQGLGFTC